MSAKKDTNHRGRFVLLCVVAFLVATGASAVFKMTYTTPEMRKYSVEWSDEVGTKVADLSYGEGEANKFDLYLPADDSKENYGLVVYLHSGGFTTGDKSYDEPTLAWLCSKGYVACGINYTLFSEDNPESSVYAQSVEIREAMPYVVEAAEEAGYHIDKMAISGGSAGGCLALLYAYRDVEAWPVPLTVCFEAVGPSSFYPEDWTSYGFDQNPEAGVALFSLMAGKEIDPATLGTAAYDDAIRDISALLWVDEDTVPTVMAYGAYDTMQPYLGSVRLDAALTEAGVTHEYYVAEHSGHGLQNDTATCAAYMEAVERYLDEYLPVE